MNNSWRANDLNSKVTGALASTAVGIAANAVKNWSNERKAGKSIAQLFHAEVLDEQKTVRPDRRRHEVAGLIFDVSDREQTDWGDDKYYEVRVINTQLPDDDRRTRTLRYFIGNAPDG